jgi:hypothetical protein
MGKIDKIKIESREAQDLCTTSRRMPSYAGSSKKNVGGGKGHKRAARGGNKKSVKNHDFCQDFMEDIVTGVDVSPLTIARVERLSGQGRLELTTVSGKTIKASLKGNLRCKKGAARSEDNPIAAMVGGFVILQEAEYGSMVMGVLNRADVSTLKMYYPDAPHSYFETTQQGGDGFDWDFDTSEEPAAESTVEKAEATAADVNIDAL